MRMADALLMFTHYQLLSGFQASIMKMANAIFLFCRKRTQVFPEYAFPFGWNRYQRMIAAMTMLISPVIQFENSVMIPIRTLIAMKRTPTVQTQPHALNAGGR